MNVLVTGGAGFIGSSLVDRLLQEGHAVVCFDNFDDFYDPGIKRGNIAGALRSSAFTLVEGDIRSRDDLDRCMETCRADIVVHLAARAGVRPSLVDPELYYEVNVIGTLRLLEAMRRHRLSRMIFGSSSSVYGNRARIPFSETDAVDSPVSPYAATKKAGELLCYTFHHLYGFDIFCLRFFTVYGPRQRPEMAIHQFAKKILKGDQLTVYGTGSSRRDYTYIDDILDGLTKSLAATRGFEILNLGESQTVSLNELIAELEKVIGRKARVKYEASQPGDVELTCADIEKARSILQYDPRWPLERGLNRVIEWLRVEPDFHP